MTDWETRPRSCQSWFSTDLQSRQRWGRQRSVQPLAWRVRVGPGAHIERFCKLLAHMRRYRLMRCRTTLTNMTPNSCCVGGDLMDKLQSLDLQNKSYEEKASSTAQSTRC